ncbi:SusC/RagA family TonB-linked outer membrane protein [Niabella hirudinis]|uniref:SusC/RagA family TonB-linked outer membrane protein n=1 Tax=Niabella hirudinis TaxID=1285929 RepID=UPI003EBFB60E
MMIKLNKSRVITGFFLLLLLALGAGVNGQANKPAASITVRGKVVDSWSGNPIAGARVTYGNVAAKITDTAGGFELNVPSKNALLEVSLDGYTAKTVPALSGKPLTIVLYPSDYHSLYEKTTTIFGDNGILKTTGAVEKQDVDGWGQNSETVDNYMQGRFSGVLVTRKSGTPSVGANVFIRNFHSLYTNNQPLYIIDGVVYDAEILSPSITIGHENNPLQNIDLRDIQDITVLKDAVATSIYGARAANGVVVINTSHAKELATRIDLQLSTGYNQPPKPLPLLDAYAYRSYLNDVLATSSYTGDEIAAMPFNNDNPSFSDYRAYHNNTDWQRQVLKSSIDKNMFLRVTGGDNIAKYALSVGYNNERGVLANTEQNKYTARFNGDMKLTQRLTAQTNISMGYGQQRLKDQGLAPVTNPVFLGLIKAPILHTNEVVNDGSVSPNYADADYFGYSNPLQILYNGINNKKAYRFLGSVVFDYKLNERFNITNLTAVTYDKAQEDFFVPKKGVSKDTVNNMEVFSRLGAQVARYYSISNDLRVRYNKKFGNENDIEAIAGFRYQKNDAEQDYALGFNSATDQLVTIGNATPVSRTYGGYIGKWVNATGYGLANLTLQNKYLVNVSLGIDGSSRFGPEADGIRISGHPYGVFPAAGVGWILSNEGFLKGSAIVNLLKLRLSYGLVGNDDIGNFNAGKNYISQNLLGVQGLVREGVANPWLQWETVQKLNAGLDLALFQERLNLKADVYQHTTKNMLVYNRGNSLSGISNYLYNNGSMKNTGIDLSIYGRLVDRRVKWDGGITLGKYKNEMGAIPETVYTQYGGATYITQQGAAANSFYGLKFEGVYSTQADADAAGLAIRDQAGKRIPFAAGDARFTDRNGDKIIDDKDRFILGNPSPDFFGAMNHSVSYKRWKFSALFTFSVGNDVYNYTRAQLESGKNFYNQTEVMLNRWRAGGQVTNVPRVSYGDPMGNAGFSDRWIEDGSYLRVRQAALEYDLKVNKQIVKYIRFYGTANNLFTWTRYLGYDPEFAASADVFNEGADVTMEPLFRSYQLGVRIGL